MLGRLRDECDELGEGEAAPIDLTPPVGQPALVGRAAQ